MRISGEARHQAAIFWMKMWVKARLSSVAVLSPVVHLGRCMGFAWVGRCVVIHLNVIYSNNFEKLTLAMCLDLCSLHQNTFYFWAHSNFIPQRKLTWGGLDRRMWDCVCVFSFIKGHEHFVIFGNLFLYFLPKCKEYTTIKMIIQRYI